MSRLALILGLVVVLRLADPESRTPAIASEGSRPTERLRAGSPLAIDGARLFALGADGRRVLQRPVDFKESWTSLPCEIPLEGITGLAAGKGKLYLTDATQGVVMRLDPETCVHDVVHAGTPLQRPREIVYADDVNRGPNENEPPASPRIYVVDAGAGMIFEIAAEGERDPPRAIELPEKMDEHTYLAFSRGTLVVSNPVQDILYRVTGVQTAGKSTVRILQSDPKVKAPETVEQRRFTYYKGRESEQGDYPRIERPAAIAAREGIVYAVSESREEIYVTPRLVRRPIRSGFTDPPVRHPSRIAVTEDSLFVSDRESGEVVRWPRPVPTEFTFEVTTPSQCLSRFYTYLSERNALPIREVALKHSLERTLLEEEILPKPSLDALNDVVCALNQDICDRGRAKHMLPAGRLIRVPDVFVEGKLVYRRTILDGKETLGVVVDRNVPSERFAHAKTEQSLREQNQGIIARYRAKIPSTSDPRPGGEFSLMLQNSGEFFVPLEVVRYVAAVPAADVRDGRLSSDDLIKLKAICPGTLVNPLEVRPSEANQTPPPPEHPDWPELETIYEQTMRDAIHYAPSLRQNLLATPYVAVVEASIDRDHPDFADSNGATPFLECAGLPGATPPSHAANTGMGSAFVRRSRAADDHGTAVAYLIAGQRQVSKQTLAGLAPAVRLLPITNDLSAMADEFGRCDKAPSVRVVNYSQKTPSQITDDGLLTFFNDRENVLFVVAAGNSDAAHQSLEMCRQHNVFPACEGRERQNLLVVGATTRDGGAPLTFDMARGEGSNWSPDYVDIVAPGDGFYAAGRNMAYVPVRGTSFAAPLAAATAALIVARGEDDPVRIKQRIIATAEYHPNLSGKVCRGGLLHVARAVSDIYRSVLISGATRTVAAAEASGPIRARRSNGTVINLGFHQILRATKIGGTFRIVYRNDEGKLDIYLSLQPPAGESWSFTYIEVDAAGAPVGVRQSGALNQLTDYIGPIG